MSNLESSLLEGGRSGISHRSSRSGRMSVAICAQAHSGARRPPMKAEKGGAGRAAPGAGRAAEPRAGHAEMVQRRSTTCWQAKERQAVQRRYTPCWHCHRSSVCCSPELAMQDGSSGVQQPAGKQVLAAAMDAASASSGSTASTRERFHPQPLLELWSRKVTLVARATREVTPSPEALSSGGQHPAGTATAEDRQADDKAEPSKASAFKRAAYSAADLVSGGHTAADLKRLRYSEDEMPSSSRRPGISNPKRPNTCSGSRRSPPVRSGLAVSARL